jgi:ribosome recycling factor
MSAEKIKACLDHTEAEMNKAISHLESELTKVRAGKANPSMLESIQVEYYGSYVPISNVASISSPDARTLVVQPWEKSSITPIEKAIMAIDRHDQNNFDESVDLGIVQKFNADTGEQYVAGKHVLRIVGKYEFKWRIRRCRAGLKKNLVKNELW